MVLEGSPDPLDNLHDNLTPPINSIIENIDNGLSDSEDEEINQYEGYAPLPRVPNDDGDMMIPYNNAVMDSDSSNDEDEEDEIEPESGTIPQSIENNPSSSNNSSVPEVESVGREVCRELWAGKFEASNIEMNSEKATQVMNAMANISLPPSSIPDWAQNLSEEEWKHQVVDRINRLREGPSNS